MAGIQVGGIVSGLDTNTIVDQLMETAKIPVDRLYGQYDYLNLEDEVYSDFNDKLSNLTSDLLSLKLESTFKSKITSSTNDSIATATATTAAAAGTHTVTVSQVANNAIASSSYTRFSLSQAGASVTEVSGLSDDYLEGVNVTTVAASGSKYVATTVLSVNNIGSMTKSKGADLSTSLFNENGRLLADLDGDFSISYVDADGSSQSLTINQTFGSTNDDITEVAARLEYYLNDGLNSSNNTNAVAYVAVRAEYDSSDNSWNMAIYETSVDDYQISVAGTDDGTLRNELGFAESYTPTTSSTTKITKYHVADSLTALQDKAFNIFAGVVAGAEYTVSGDLTEGTFTIAQDATLSVSSSTYAYYTSGQASGGVGLDTAADGLDAAGFTETVSSDANGFFTINDVKITIEDYTDISVNDLLGIINASGAGVTATYDSDTDKFKIRSNETGSTSISLGDYSDTSNLLEVMKLEYTDDVVFTSGTSEGSISADSNLTDSNLTVYPFTGTFTINGVSIYVDVATESLNDVIEKVNNSGAGVTMSYDANSDKVTLKSDTIDAITVGSASDSSNLLEALNLTANTNVVTTIGEAGQKAVVIVDGTTYIRDTNEIDDIITGVTLTLNGVSTSTATIKVEVDTEKAAKAFAKFLAHYNEIMEALNVPEKDDGEDDYTDYLTDKEKESMSDDEISTYLEYYKLYNTYDIIRRSSELRNMDSALRKLFFAERSGISGAFNDMSDLGIEIANAGDLDTEFDGYLVEYTTDYDTILQSLLDNQTFIDALSDNADEVHKFFANSVDEDDDSYDTTAGWARYYSKMLEDRYTSSDGMIGSKLGLSGTIYSEMSGLADRITNQEDRVEQELERYWAQFTAMEQAIADAQAQAADFSNASGG